MSIVLGEAQGVGINPLWPLAALVVAALLAWRARVFAPNSIVGPRRLAQRESPASVFLVLVIAVSAALMAAQVYASLHPAPPNGATSRPGDEQRMGVQQLTAGYVEYLTAIAATLAATALLRPEGLDRLGLRWRQIAPGAPIAVLSLLIVLPAIFWTEQITVIVLRHWNINPTEHPLFEFMRDDQRPGVRWAAILSAVALAPVGEEMLFRGLAQTTVRYWTRRPWLAVVIVSGLFAALHPASSRPAIFVLALGLGYVYERTGNLWASMFLHALFNGTQVFLFFHTS